MNAYLRFVRISLCLLALFFAQAVFFAGSALAKKIYVEFEGQGSGTVTVEVNGSNAGIYSNDHTINHVDKWASVSVTAKASPGSEFTGWGGVVSGSASTTDFVMGGDHQTIMATFSTLSAPPPVETATLSLTINGAGSGTVSLIGTANSYLNRGGGSYEFDQNEAVTLTAKPGGSDIFSGWGGSLSGTSISKILTMSSDNAVTATFSQAGTETPPPSDTTIPGCGTSKYTDYSAGFEASHFDLNNVSVNDEGYLQLQTGADAIDPNNIIIPFEQEVSVTFLYEGAGHSLTDFGWMLAADGVGGEKREVYQNINDNNNDGVLDGQAGIDHNDDGNVDARDNRRTLGTFAAGTELVFYLKVDNESKTFYTKTDAAWNPDNWNGSCSGDSFIKTYNLGLALTSEGSCQQNSNWMNQTSLDRLSDLFDLTFADDDKSTLKIERHKPFSHVIVGAPGNKPNEWVLGWEDLSGGGDTDHNDVVFQIERRTGGVARLEMAQAIEPDEAGAYYTAVQFEVYDNIPCSGKTDINYYVSIDNGTNWVEITAWDTVKEYTLDDDGTKILGADVAYWSPGSPQYTFRSRRLDFAGLGIIGRQLIWKTVLSSEEETCVAEIVDVSLNGTVATHADISRASPVVQANVLYSGSFETPAVSWASTDLRGHLRATRIYDPLNPEATNYLELWDAGAVLTATNPNDRNIFYPSITLNSVTGEALATADGAAEDFSGTLAHFPVLAESITITVGSETFTDQHTDVLKGNLGGTGSINRFTGEWEITPYNKPTVGQPLIANYDWYATLSAPVAFTSDNVTNALLGLNNTYVIGAGYRYDFNNSGSYTEADGDWLVNWVRGYANGSNTKKDWLLEPIDHSVPAVVTPPGRPLWYYGTDITSAERTTYDDFIDANKDRDTIVLVGSRGGMLHAFDAGQFRWGNNDLTSVMEQRGYFLWDVEGEPDYGDGTEKWAFIPANLLPRLKNNYLKGEDRAFVDASPAVSDVYIDGTWKTVALCAQGNGGDTVFALDITNTASPKFMWEFADPDLFRSRSSPAVAVLGRIVDGGQKKWAAFFVSGETYDDTLYPSIYVINIADGSVIERIFLNCEPAGAGGVPSGQPAIVDTDGNGFIDRMYIGTDKGYLYKVNLPDSPDHAAYPISHCIVNGDFDYVKIDDKGTSDTSDDEETTEEVPVEQRGHSIYASPTVVVDNSLTASGGLQYNVRIFFGTGDSPYADEDIDTGNTAYHFFAYTDHAVKGSIKTSDIELAWFEALPAGHRVFASAFAAAGNVYFGTATSDTEDPCEGPNEGRIFGFTYSGLSVINDADGNHGLEVGDISTAPLVEDEHLYFKTTDGTQGKGGENYNNAVPVGGLPYTRLRHWREIF